MFNSALTVIMQIPLQTPVFKAELMSKMYHPATYFYGRFISNYLFDVTAPLLMFFTAFYALGANTEPQNVLQCVGVTMLMGILGNAVGYVCALLFDDHVNARNFLVMILILWICNMGVLVNIDTNAFTRFAQYLSPPRFASEIMLKSLTNGKHISIVYEGQVIYDLQVGEVFASSLKYNFGISNCFSALGCWSLFYVLSATCVIWFRNWKFI